MAEADSLEALQQAADRILDQLEKERAAGAVDTFFVPSMIFPGRERRARTLEAEQTPVLPGYSHVVSPGRRPRRGSLARFTKRLRGPRLQSVGS